MNKTRFIKIVPNGELKEALNKIFYFIRNANKYFDDEKPWLTYKSDIEKCKSGKESEALLENFMALKKKMQEKSK